MQIKAIKTPKFFPPKMDMFDVFEDFVTDVQDGDILFISSKIVSIHQGRCIKTEYIKDKEKLIDIESDAVLRDDSQEGITVGLKHAIANPFGGIDESNGNGYTILQPENPSEFAGEVYKYLIKKFGLKKLGVVIVDSAFLPMRSGAITMSIGSYGLDVVTDHCGTKDIFGRELKMSQSNIVDSLSMFAGLYLGGGGEQTPIVIMKDVSMVKFTNTSTHDKLTELSFGDSYGAFLKLFRKI